MAAIGGSGVNWGSLANVQFPKGGVVAQAHPAAAVQNPLDSLSGGLMKGLSDAQGIRGQAISNQYNSLRLQQAQQEVQDAATLKQHNNDNKENYLKAVQQVQGPLGVAAAQKTFADSEKAISDAEQAKQVVESGSYQASTNSALAYGQAANIAHGQQQFTTQKAQQQLTQQAAQQLHIPLDPQTGQPTKPLPNQIQQQIQQQATQAGAAAGQQAWSFSTSQLPTSMQQSLKEHDLTTWNEHTNAAFHWHATAEAANQMPDSKAMSNKAKDAQTMTKWQIAAADGDKEAQMNLDNLKGQIQNNDKAAAGLLLSSPDQLKRFTTLQDNDAKIDQSRTQLNQLVSKIKDIPDKAPGPFQGAAFAKYTAQGEALKADINQIVLEAPGLFGLPGSSLRLGSIWKIVQGTKPDTPQWKEAMAAIGSSLQYGAALNAERNWKQEAELMKAQSIRSNPDAQAQAKQWFQDHPEPLSVVKKPDLTPIYKLYPSAKGQIEQDWNDAMVGKSTSPVQQQNSLSNQAQTSGSLGQQTGYTPDQLTAIQQEAKKRGLIK